MIMEMELHIFDRKITTPTTLLRSSAPIVKLSYRCFPAMWADRLIPMLQSILYWPLTPYNSILWETFCTFWAERVKDQDFGTFKTSRAGTTSQPVPVQTRDLRKFLSRRRSEGMRGSLRTSYTRGKIAPLGNKKSNLHEERPPAVYCRMRSWRQ